MIEFILTNPKLISVNEQYMHPVKKTKSGRYTSYVCKSPYLKEVQSYYVDVLKKCISDEAVESLSKEVERFSSGLELEIVLGLPRKDFYEYDVSNFIKALEDCIVVRTGVDDSCNFKVSILKQLYLSENDDWRMKVKISPIKLFRFED